MTTKYAPYIKALRIQRGHSQADISVRLGISRPSYVAVEQGKRELTFSEAEKLTSILGVTLRELETGVTPDYEKYKQMILAFLRSAASKKTGKIPKTKLAKLVYLADFAWFYSHLESMSGMQYRKLPYGPVPDQYFRAIEELYDAGQIAITQTEDGAMLIAETDYSKKNDLAEIKAEEKKLIQKIAEKWKDKNTKEIVAFTHNQLPYAVCAENEVIPYELITQENPDDVY